MELGSFQPVLQAQDGSFVGTVSGTYSSSPAYMVAVDQSGNVRWSLAGYQPQIATADGGVIAQPVDSNGNVGQSATIFDQNGNATGQIASLPIYSWKGAYEIGSVRSLVPLVEGVALILDINLKLRERPSVAGEVLIL